MKKKFLIIYFIIMFLSVFIYSSFASTNFQNRTSDNLHVGKNITITSSNKQAILKTPYVDASEKIYDFANLFSDSEEKELYNLATNFIDVKNMDMVIVTIDNNNKSSAMDYADDFYDYNDFGKGTSRDGALILIDMFNRKVYISTTGNAILMYASRIDSIIDSGYDNLKNGEYYNTFSNMIEKMSYYFDLGPDENDLRTIIIDEYGKPSYIKYVSYPLIGFISGIITLIVTLIIYNMSKLKIKVGSTISYLKDKNITKREDTLVNTVVTHTLRHVDTDSGGGHSSGGGSFHSSSSGSFHGGGGRSF